MRALHTPHQLTGRFPLSREWGVVYVLGVFYIFRGLDDSRFHLWSNATAGENCKSKLKTSPHSRESGNLPIPAPTAQITKRSGAGDARPAPVNGRFPLSREWEKGGECGSRGGNKKITITPIPAQAGISLSWVRALPAPLWGKAGMGIKKPPLKFAKRGGIGYNLFGNCWLQCGFLEENAG